MGRPEHLVLISRLPEGAMSEKLAAILVSDVVGYSRLAGTDEGGALPQLRALRSDLIELVHLRLLRPHRRVSQRR